MNIQFDGDDKAEIQTEENVAISYRLADLGSRGYAAIIDILIQIAAFLGIFILIGIGLSASETSLNDVKDNWGISIIIAVLSIVSFLLLWGYYIFFELKWEGQTPGKRSAGIRVVRETGGKMSFSHVFLRNILRVIDFLPSFYGIGIIAIFIGKSRKRLGDMVAGTIVIKETDGSFHENDLRATDLAFAFPEAWKTVQDNISRLDYTDIKLIQTYLSRKDKLRHYSKAILESSLFNAVSKKLGLTANLPGSHHEAFLLEVIRAYTHQD